MKKFPILLFLFTCTYSFTNAQNWLWGKAGYGSMKSNVYGMHLATDKQGNAYQSGMFGGALIFYPDSLIYGSDNAYMVKYNSAGQVKWAIIPTFDQYGPAIATDTGSNVYITGINVGSGLFYVMKYNTNGSLI
ncbi:MAG TPA: hypothetical protein VNZ45_17905, partial [Bacteroidia bacterium]|nr:hypothetical protein [Bacteroidia bacterium]